MAFDLKTYLRLLYLLLVRRKLTFRWICTFFRTGIRTPLFYVFTTLSYILDNLFFGKFRLQAVKSPVFIVGTPRSGTTFLFRLMCEDKERFTYFKLYHILFPSIIVRRIIDFIAVIDSFIKGRLTKWLDKFEEKIFKDHYYLHEFGIRNAEEDDIHFIHCFHTPIIYLVSPFADKIKELAFFDTDSGLKKKRGYMRFYEGCIKRHLYLAGGDKNLLSKNVWGLGKLRATSEQFPGARFLYIIRNPYDSIGSLLSYYYFLLKKSDPQSMISSELSMAIVDVACNLYLYAQDVFDGFDEDSFMIIKYDDLVARPKEIVEMIYSKWDMEIGVDFAIKLKNDTDKSKNYKSRHSYSLEQFGVNKDVVYNRLRGIFEKYNFECSGVTANSKPGNN